jgi:hypothetical protein
MAATAFSPSSPVPSITGLIGGDMFTGGDNEKVSKKRRRLETTNQGSHAVGFNPDKKQKVTREETVATEFSPPSPVPSIPGLIGGDLFAEDDNEEIAYEDLFAKADFTPISTLTTAAAEGSADLVERTPTRKTSGQNYKVRQFPSKGKKPRSPEKFSKKRAWLEATNQGSHAIGFKRCFFRNSEYESKEERLVRKKDCIRLQRRALFKTRYELWELQEQLFKFSKKVSRMVERLDVFIDDDLSEDSDISEENAATRYAWGDKNSDEEFDSDQEQDDNDDTSRQ